MRKVLMILFFVVGIGLLGYFGFEMYSIKSGQTEALSEIQDNIDNTVLKQGGGDEPLPILNGKTPLTTANGTREYTDEDLKKALLERKKKGKDDSGVAGDSGSNGSSNGDVNTDALAPDNTIYDMSNILDYYQKQAAGVDFNALANQAYGNYYIGQTIGVLYIPRLDRSLPIIYGTAEEELRYGVGFHTDTKLPGLQDQILLAGHRDTVFRSFGKLQIGDEFHVKTAKGTYIYTIFASQIVDWDDETVIQSTYPYEVLTVSTCYPFNYLGPAPERYILYAK